MFVDYEIKDKPTSDNVTEKKEDMTELDTEPSQNKKDNDNDKEQDETQTQTQKKETETETERETETETDKLNEKNTETQKKDEETTAGTPSDSTDDTDSTDKGTAGQEDTKPKNNEKNNSDNNNIENQEKNEKDKVETVIEIENETNEKQNKNDNVNESVNENEKKRENNESEGIEMKKEQKIIYLGVDKVWEFQGVNSINQEDQKHLAPVDYLSIFLRDVGMCIICIVLWLLAFFLFCFEGCGCAGVLVLFFGNCSLFYVLFFDKKKASATPDIRLKALRLVVTPYVGMISPITQIDNAITNEYCSFEITIEILKFIDDILSAYVRTTNQECMYGCFFFYFFFDCFFFGGHVSCMCDVNTREFMSVELTGMNSLKCENCMTKHENMKHET